MSEVAIVIPARYASSRFPGKPLAPLRGAGGESRSLLARSIAAARAAVKGAAVFVATDDTRIAEEAARCAAAVIMTDAARRNGTERVAQAVERAKIGAEIIVNFQGDAPLTPPWFIERLIAEMRSDTTIKVATPMLRCDPEGLENLRRDRREGRVGATTVVVSRQRNALYFSREVLPFLSASDPAARPTVYHHVGLYAYRRDALAAYVGWEPGPLETAEGLEQLRFLENGWPIRAVEVDAKGRAFWELNNPSDVPLIESYLAAMNIA